jgi:hypothetical protein
VYSLLSDLLIYHELSSKRRLQTRAANRPFFSAWPGLPLRFDSLTQSAGQARQSKSCLPPDLACLQVKSGQFMFLIFHIY